MAYTGYDYNNQRWDMVALLLIGLTYRIFAWFFLKFTHAEKQGSYPLFTNIQKKIRRVKKMILKAVHLK
jgi:hypothetical protein